jgi:hypothetical protein
MATATPDLVIAADVMQPLYGPALAGVEIEDDGSRLSKRRGWWSAT